MLKKILNLNFNLPKFGTGGGINRHKYIIIFVIFLFSINIKSFGEITATEPTYNNNNQYEISSKEELYWFAQMINGENGIKNPEDRTTDAKLTQDIEVISSTDTKAYEGLQSLLTGTEYYSLEYDQKTALDALKWTPIGKHSTTKKYKGIFDGNNKTISGLYFNDSEQNYVGLFGCAENAMIKNVGVKNSYFGAKDYVGGVIGYFSVASGLETKEVVSCYSRDCVIKRADGAVSGNVGGVVGYFDIVSGAGEVSSCYSVNSQLEGAYVGGVIGYFNIRGGTGKVSSCYSVNSQLEGNSTGKVGGVVGYFDIVSGAGEVVSCYSKGCVINIPSSVIAKSGGVIGYFNIRGGTGKVSSCFYDSTGQSKGTGNKIDKESNNDVTGVKDDDFKNGTVLAGLNTCFKLDSKPFKQDLESEIKDLYPVHVWSQRIAYVVFLEVVDREYVHPVEKYKLSEKIKIGDKEYKYWRNLDGAIVTEVNTKSGPVTVYGPEKLLKIPVRVKINYDPSNNLETWVKSNLKHEFFRKIDGGGWKTMFEDKQYSYDVSPVSGSIKINPDGSKTQDFVFNYYIYQAKDRNGKAYQFGFNKKYPVKTYLREDVGGGKKLFIDYGVFGRK